MKLKSILIMTMVAIMAVAGGAFAATTTTTSTNTDAGGAGFAGGVQLNFGGALCNSVANTAVACAAMNAAQATAFATDSQTGSGTGLTNGMPAQVVYNPNAWGATLGAYTSGTGPQAGYALTQSIFGMCAFSGGVQGNCPKFVPTAAAASAATIGGLLIASGGGNAADGGAGTIASSTIPTGTAVFNEATFVTGLVSSGGITPGTFVNQLSQKTFHHSTVANLTGSADGDFIDQRLAQVIGTVQTLAQSTTLGGSSNNLAVVVTNAGAEDPTFVGAGHGNIDPFLAMGVAGVTVATSTVPSAANYAILTAASFAANGGAIQQAIADSTSGGNGDYGQIFTNDGMSVTNALGTPAVAAPGVSYSATGATTGVPVGNISVLP